MTFSQLLKRRSDAARSWRTSAARRPTKLQQRASIPTSRRRQFRNPLETENVSTLMRGTNRWRRFRALRLRDEWRRELLLRADLVFAVTLRVRFRLRHRL